MEDTNTGSQPLPPMRSGGSAFDYAGHIQGCARGDRSSLRAIYDRDAGLMLGIAGRILQRRDLAEDAVQDALVQIWSRAATFDPSRASSARAWLLTIVRHRALNMRRDGSREHAVDLESLAELADDAPTPEAIVEGLSEASRLRHCLEQIDGQRRNCIVLAYAFGLTHGEVAGRLGVPLGTVKAWIRRSLLALRQCLQ